MTDSIAGHHICKCGHHQDLHFYRQTPNMFGYTECTGGKIIMKDKKRKKYYNDETKVFKQCLCDGFVQIERIWKDIWDRRAGKYFDPDTGQYKEDGGYLIKIE